MAVEVGGAGAGLRGTGGSLRERVGLGLSSSGCSKQGSNPILVEGLSDLGQVTLTLRLQFIPL